MIRQNREAEILARLYDERMEVYRSTFLKDPDTGETKQANKKVYQDTPCRLSQMDESAPERGDVAAKLSNKYKIFAGSDVCLNEGDRVKVRTRDGRLYEGISGRSFGYYSHIEAELKVEKIS